MRDFQVLSDSGLIIGIGCEVDPLAIAHLVAAHLPVSVSLTAGAVDAVGQASGQPLCIGEISDAATPELQHAPVGGRCVYYRAELKQFGVTHVRYLHDGQAYELWLYGPEKRVCALRSPVSDVADGYGKASLAMLRAGDYLGAFDEARKPHAMGMMPGETRIALARYLRITWHIAFAVGMASACMVLCLANRAHPKVLLPLFSLSGSVISLFLAFRWIVRIPHRRVAVLFASGLSSSVAFLGYCCLGGSLGVASSVYSGGAAATCVVAVMAVSVVARRRLFSLSRSLTVDMLGRQI